MRAPKLELEGLVPVFFVETIKVVHTRTPHVRVRLSDLGIFILPFPREDIEVYSKRILSRLLNQIQLFKRNTEISVEEDLDEELLPICNYITDNQIPIILYRKVETNSIDENCFYWSYKLPKRSELKYQLDL